MEHLPELVAGHQDSLFAFLYRMCGDADLAEELMQETFVRALRAAGRYRPDARLTTWLFQIAANLLKDRWRQHARRGASLPLDDVALEAPDSTEALALEAVRSDAVRQALLKIPADQRSVLVLRYYHDLKYEEIAEVLMVPVGTVRSRIHNGLTRLKRELQAEVTVS